MKCYKKNLKFSIYFSLLFILFTFLGCTLSLKDVKEKLRSNTDNSISAIDVSVTKNNIPVNETVELLINLYPESASKDEVSIEIFPEEGIRVNYSNGVYRLTGQKSGDYKITVSSLNSDKKGETYLTVYEKALVKYYDNGTLLTEKTLQVGQIIASSRENYLPDDSEDRIFSGWYLDSELATPVVYPFLIDKNEISFYGKWVLTTQELTVSFDKNCPDTITGSITPITGLAGTIIELPEIERDGYLFTGWYETADCTGYPYKGSYKLRSGLTLYAGWVSDSDLVSVTGVEFEEEPRTIYVGDSTSLNYKILPDTASDKTVSFTSSNTSVATVDITTGIVRGVSAGEATITVKTNDGGFEDSIKICVTEYINVESIKLDKSELTLQTSESYKLLAIVEPATATANKIEWVSDNPEIAVVTEGVVTGIGTGETTIRAMVDGKSAECKVTVVEPVPVEGIILHAYDYCNLYVWETGDANLDKTHIAMSKEGDTSWYTYTLNVESANIIFTKEPGGWSSQTGNLSRVAGEWWYKNGTWYSYNPEDSVPPTILVYAINQNNPVTGVVVFTVSAQDDKNLSSAIITINGKEYTQKMTGLSDSVNIEWDSSVLKNGTYTATVKVFDFSGNVSQEKTIKIETINANRPPVAVITGSSLVDLGAEKTYNAKSSYDPNGLIAGYSWSVTGGASIIGSTDTDTVTVKFPAVDSVCTLTLTVTDDDGATSTDQKTINVREASGNDFREETIYFTITTRFYDGDSSNNVHCWDENELTPPDDPSWRGDFKGLIEKLDYIKALGFSAIWITPVVENCSGMDYHGYHAMNFSKVDPRYESEDVDFQTLIDEVHARDMKLILDVVFNHTGNFGEDFLAPMFVKDYSADLEDINACLKFHPNTLLTEDYWTVTGAEQYQQRLALMKNTDNVNHDWKNYYHHYGHGNWDTFSSQWMQIAGDCVDLNTENPAVLNYIIKAYSQYIKMGVDGFRIDTGKHIPRLVFNKVLNDAFMNAASEYGNDNFYMFTEICARANEVIYRQTPNMSACFYTWKEEKDYPWDPSETSWNDYVMFETEMLQAELESGSKMFEHTNANSAQQQGLDYAQGTESKLLISDNHELINNTYRKPDYSMHSGLNVIDFPMHWNFNSAESAFGVRGGDKYYNDATWNVVYVDSHDYSPSDDCFNRYNKGTDAWAENCSLMFTFRGIPCLYYGSEIEFQAGAIIDKGPLEPLYNTGRAYFGDYITGTVNATDFGIYTATGTVAETLNHPLAQHIRRLNMIRREVPALQKGQYSTDGCSGKMAFKRRYTDESVDSFVLVTISEGSTFTDIPNGIYTDCVTGNSITVTDGTLTAECTGKGNARIYVLNGPGKIGEDGVYLQ